MTDKANLDLKTFAPGELRPVDFYKAFPIDMEVVGRYHDLSVFTVGSPISLGRCLPSSKRLGTGIN